MNDNRPHCTPLFYARHKPCHHDAHTGLTGLVIDNINGVIKDCRANSERINPVAFRLFDLTGKRALITGSSQGIGFALAQGLAAAGASIVLNGRDAGKLAAAAARIPGAETLLFDATDHVAVRTAVDGYEAQGTPIDILVNNAGMQHRAPLEDFPADAFERLLQTNIATVFHVGQAVARHMIARGRGHIINIASVQTALARPSIAPYTATKGAVGNLTKGMATDWARHGLNCNAIAPGYFDTPLNAALVGDPAFTAWLEKRTPAGRWGRVEELQGACIFLASDAASFINGHILYVDGGITASL
jgi:gluconate 5-dehydrogenase